MVTSEDLDTDQVVLIIRFTFRFDFTCRLQRCPVTPARWSIAQAGDKMRRHYLHNLTIY